jgi:hypothetical protein
VSRSELWFIPAFCLLVAGVTWVSFGNPLSLEGTKLQEFVGYIIGLLLAAVGLLLVVTRVVTTSPTAGTLSRANPPRASE